MNGLKAARVAIIDDNPDESLLLVRALSRLGVGVVCFNGESDQLPTEGLSGIRLVFLDLRLLEGEHESKQYVSHALTVLKRVVKPSHGCTGLILWAKNEEDALEVDAQLPAVRTAFEPAFVTKFPDKAAFAEKLEAFDELGKSVNALLRGEHGASLLWDWEQSVHDAATGTTDLLSEVAVGEGGDLLKVLASLAVASGGKRSKTNRSCVCHLFEGLNPVHYDLLEQIASADMPTDAHARQLKARVKEGVTLLAPQSALLNRILLASPAGAEGRAVQPGNVYVFRTWKEAKYGTCPVPAYSTAKFKEYVAELWSIPKERNADQQKKLDKIAAVSVPCAVEITPACDHDQEKAPLARLLGGLIIKDEQLKLPTPSRVFAKQVEAVHILSPRHKLDGAYTVVVSARHLFSAHLNDLVRRTPVIRLRHQVVTDIRAWFASHAARPGYTSVV
jgi:hypothetical protein